ncbi:MAG: chemotaxis protein CheD [Spirochaetes bacterium]|nr:chemotaxis protein CheD [Spirochaetota bacterium]
MYLKETRRYGKPVKIIHAGEFYTSGNDELIQTLLGSCVAVCLYDPVRRISGMNHFMLPGRISRVDIFNDRSARYGITAINTLIEAMLGMGSEKKSIVAKVFGGGSVIEYRQRAKSIPEDNVRVARVMLEMADIQMLEIDTGGAYSRKIVMDVLSGEVYCKKSASEKIAARVFSRQLGRDIVEV